MVTTEHGSSVLWSVDGRGECTRYIARSFVENRSDDHLSESAYSRGVMSENPGSSRAAWRFCRPSA